MSKEENVDLNNQSDNESSYDEKVKKYWIVVNLGRRCGCFKVNSK